MKDTMQHTGQPGEQARSGQETAGEAARRLRHTLTPLYGQREAASIVRLIFHHLKGWDLRDMLLFEASPLTGYISEKLAEIERRLLSGEPIQYITGTAHFHGMDLHVEPGVLVPRPETEELVDLIARENPGSDLRVLDVGTGSGCIAIALSRSMRFPAVTALDLSATALAVARANASALHARGIDFIHADIFTWEPPADSYDIIVSNPPYVDESERAGMERHVLDHEPAEALFVPDSDPLLYYRRITAIAREALIPGGRLYFEINPRHVREMERLVAEAGFSDIAIHRDLSGKDRILSARM